MIYEKSHIKTIYPRNPSQVRSPSFNNNAEQTTDVAERGIGYCADKSAPLNAHPYTP